MVIDRYLSYLAVERGLAANSLSSYRRDLTRLCEFCDEQNIAVTDVTPSDLHAFIAKLGAGSSQHSALSASSIARITAAVRGLYRFLHDEGLMAHNPAIELRRPQLPQRLPKALTTEQITTLIESVPTDSVVGLRDRAFLEFLYGTGARVSEAVGIDIDDVIGSSGVIDAVRLFGKGNKERVVPVGSYAADAINSYVVRSRPQLAAAGKGNAALFLNTRGNRLSRQSGWAIIQLAAQRAFQDVPVHLSPHVLRHSFATHLLQGGADVRVVQELLGHASVTTTQLYTKVTADHLREVYLQSHPRARD